ncbi:MAG: ABC transporter substrate-binding protein [Verrucomicrobiota bacterium]|nr:ABC transporter substrate-binding protein [Verrucomicrobiota bacterium]
MHRNKLITAAVLAALALTGCSKKETAKEESKKVRVGYIGLTCEASIFSAVENGYFKDEGLDVELIKCDWKNYKDTLALGGYDITQHLVMYFLKPIEQGLDVKFTGGIHTGCLRVQASAKSDITTVEQLRGKRIGVPGMGTPPFVYANRVLKRHGIDGSKEIEWKVFPVGELGLAIDKGEVDAVANSEPIGSMLLESGKVRNVADQAVDEGDKDEYCCEVIANGKWLTANPKTAAAATRALLKGAKYVEANPKAAAEMSVEKKYLASNPKLNALALSKLSYIPSVSRAAASVKTAAQEMIAAGMLAPNTNVDELSKRAFAHLDGVTDEWIEKTDVKKVAGGQMLPTQDDIKVALSKVDTSCCAMPVATN